MRGKKLKVEKKFQDFDLINNLSGRIHPAIKRNELLRNPMSAYFQVRSNSNLIIHALCTENTAFNEVLRCIWILSEY